jgi:hypothetical protein
MACVGVVSRQLRVSHWASCMASNSCTLLTHQPGATGMPPFISLAAGQMMDGLTQTVLQERSKKKSMYNFF